MYVSPAEARKVQERKARVHAHNEAARLDRQAASRREALARLAPRPVVADYAPATAVAAMKASPKRDARGRFVKATA